jgi:hypothetical protein
MHVQTMGVAAMQGLQGPQPVPRGVEGDVFFATRQVTRHYIGYHGASPDIEAQRGHGSSNFIASNRSLADSYFPTYGSCHCCLSNKAPFRTERLLMNLSSCLDPATQAMAETEFDLGNRRVSAPEQRPG